jgi:hypothetical protein
MMMRSMSTAAGKVDPETVSKAMLTALNNQVSLRRFFFGKVAAYEL